MLFVNLTQGSKEWLEFRSRGIGASDIPSILGVKGAYKSRNALLKEKLHGAEKVSSFTQSIFNAGHEWEEVVRKYLESIGENFTPAVAVHPLYPEFFASLDGVNDAQDALIEVKHTKKESLFEEFGKGNIPHNFYWQIQWQFYVTEIDTCHLLLVKDGQIQRAVIRANKEQFERLEQEAFKFQSDLNNLRSFQPIREAIQ